MLKKRIKYTDYDGNEREEDFYFNLTKAEVAEMELRTEGGFENFIQKVVAEKNQDNLVTLFKDFILKSYGEKSADGKYFTKSEEITKRFVSTEAYTELFMELTTDANAAALFFNGIMPKVPAAPPKN